ncbi:serine hydrolase domain-containing protein [Streptomyces sp. NPDC048172]|uniref:serine hydrolase domain-containing protein n=1 Tax=Streptomyces sp. NPDC048172 TaxID=3365505 RepID=UPI00371E5BF7
MNDRTSSDGTGVRRTRRTSRTRLRGLTVATSLVASLAVASPLALASPQAPTPTDVRSAAATDAPDAKALRAALAGLPDDDTTAALVRVGGTDGTWRGSAGVADVTTGREALPHGRFRAGSTTKVFTAAVVLQLASERRVALDAPVNRYLPELLPTRYAKVTVGQLLNHTSGIPAADIPRGDFEELYEHRFETVSPRALIASATSKKPEFRPGTRQHYLNINYTVLGLLIERLTHTSYEEAVSARVLRPLGLRHTSLPGHDPRLTGPHNRGYERVPAKHGGTRLLDVTEWNMSASWAAGDLISTTADLERFLHALFRGDVVPSPALRNMFTVPDVPMYDPEGEGKPQPAAYSMGLTRMPLPDGTFVWGKSGGRYGYNTLLAARRDLSRTVVYSVNATDAKGQDLNPTAQRIIQAALR